MRTSRERAAPPATRPSTCSWIDHRRGQKHFNQRHARACRARATHEAATEEAEAAVRGPNRSILFFLSQRHAFVERAHECGSVSSEVLATAFRVDPALDHLDDVHLVLATW